jgi:hypothetical protein
VVIARSWWHDLVGDEFGGMRWSIGGHGFLGLRRNPYRMAGTNAVMPTGTAIPSLRASGVPLSHALRVPGETLGLVRGSSVVIVASLLECVAWYAALRSAKSVVEILWRAQRLRIIIFFIDPMLLTLFSFIFSFCFFFLSFFLLG